MEASKWLDIQLLISEEEMGQLFSEQKPFRIFLTGRVVPIGEGEISQEHFLKLYQQYCHALKNGKAADLSHPFASSIWTLSSDVVRVQKIDAKRELLKLIAPAVQLQPHAMIYSAYEGKFHSMSYGKESIQWGLQFSYPQLYLEPSNGEIMKVDESDLFPNTALFRQIQRWVRKQTIPTPMQTPLGKINLPVRLGRDCFSWINRHPQLQSQQLACQIDKL